MQFEDFTAAHEAAYIQLAQSGVRGAANALFMIYLEQIMAQHKFGPVGCTPKKLGYNWNPKSLKFDRLSGEIFLNFYKAIMNYDFRASSKTARHPFLAYFRPIMDFRAQDILNKEASFAKTTSTFSDLKLQAAQKGQNQEGEEIMEISARRKMMYDSEKDDRKQRELRKMVEKLLRKADLDKKAIAFIKGFLEVCDEPDGYNNTMRKTGQRIVSEKRHRSGRYSEPKTQRDPRTIAYYWASRCMVHLDDQQKQRFYDIMEELDG